MNSSRINKYNKRKMNQDIRLREEIINSYRDSVVVVKQPELPTSETEFINIFFKENLEQLDVYKLSFEDVPYKNQNDYAKICQKKIREIYLPSVNQLINNKYKDIKENDHVKKFIERLNTLKDVDSKRFLYKLTRIIEKHQLNI